MQIIKKSLGIGKTIRNVGRLKEIVLVFAKHGFAEFLSKAVFLKVPDLVLPQSKIKIREEFDKEENLDWSNILGQRLRACFEDLGPTFIKFGQLLSTREDIFEQGFISEMQLLRDRVSSVPFEIVKKSIENSLGKKIDEVFLNIDQKPIGTASIGVVFKGKLLDGTNVAIKVRRPKIDKLIETDFSILIFLVEQAEKMSKEVRLLGLSRVIKDFSVSLHIELNFFREALNGEILRENLGKHDSEELFHIPKVYDDFTKEDLLVTELLEGIPFTDHINISKHSKELVPKMEQALQIFIKTFLKDGFFHADLHGGNFFLLENGKIGLIDFGLMGNLGLKSRQNFLAIIYSILTYNFENLVYEFLDVAEYEEIPDVDKLVRDVRNSLSPFIGLTVNQTNFSLVFTIIVKNLNTHQLFLPRDWFIVFRALITLDGVGKSLEMDFDIYSLLQQNIRPLIRDSVRKEELVEDAIWLGKDVLSSMRIIPRYLKWFLKDSAKKGFSLEIIHSGHEKSIDKMSGAIVFLGMAVVASIFCISGVLFILNKDILSWRDVPLLSYTFWTLGLLILIKGSLGLRKMRLN